MKAVKASTDPVWLADAELPEFSELNRDIVTDVCLVGGGITGLSTAYLLARAGREITLIDDGSIVSGQTLCTTAHVSNVPDGRYAQIERQHGADGARAVADALTAALGKIESNARDEQIDCDFRRVNAHLFLAPSDNEETLFEEFNAARRAGLTVERHSESPVPSVVSGPCLRYANQAQFQPVKYLAGLANAIQRNGGNIFTNTHASLITGGKDASVDTVNGQRIRAKSIVVATHTPFNDRVAIHTKQYPYLTYVIAARVPRGAIPLGLYWDTANPFHYVRLHRLEPREPAQSHEGNEHDLLIVGGEDHKTGHAQDGDERFARLEHWARERFPEMQDVEYRWAGQILESADGLPFIGRNPMDEDNVYVATGFSGLGMTNGTLAGMIISDLILGRENPWVKLYNPSRKIKSLPGLREFVKENIDVARQYVSHLSPGEVDSTEEIPTGEGAILRRGLRKVAVYRDDSGKLCELSAVCPHLGCVVAWNATEKTWDCPCHGSRFGANGEVRQGPANTNLEPVQE